MITNGNDLNSYYNEKQLIGLAKEFKVLVYPVGFVGDLSTNSRIVAMDQQSKSKVFLERLAKGTGGRAFFSTSSDELVNIGKQIMFSLHRETGSPCQ